jgi:hypothetical protein
MIGFMAIFSRQTRSGGASAQRTINNSTEIAPICLHEIAAGTPRPRKLTLFTSAARWTTMPPNKEMEAAMRADRVELSWDAAKSNWLIRITSGEEVIRRHFQARKDADDKTLLTTAQQEVSDEGYEADPAQVTIKR